MLQAMGFTAEQARAALLATDQNMERAADWLFSRDGDLDAAVAAVLNPSAAPNSSTGKCYVFLFFFFFFTPFLNVKFMV